MSRDAAFVQLCRACVVPRSCPGIVRPRARSGMEESAQFGGPGWALPSSRNTCQAMADSPVLPGSSEELGAARRAVLEKTLYEVNYELNNRPDWLRIPLRGVLHELGNH